LDTVPSVISFGENAVGPADSENPQINRIGKEICGFSESVGNQNRERQTEKPLIGRSSDADVRGADFETRAG
jgi:hypothetical protein